MRVSTLHVYGIIGHQLPEGEAAPDGIELYTKELVRIQLDLQELEQDISELTVGRFGQIETGDAPSLVHQVRAGIDPPEQIQDLETRYQELLKRIAGTRAALVTGHVSKAGIDPDEYSEHTRRYLHKWVDDGTFPDYIHELEQGADRVGHRLAAKRETSNTRTNLLISLITLGVSCLIVVFGALSLIATVL